MALLLDTHLLLWALAEPRRLSPAVQLELEATDVYVSAASIWEIAIKSGLGKIDIDPAEILSALEPTGFLLLNITGAHAAAVTRLPPVHKDPFDRLLVTQAQLEGMPLVTNDALLADYGAVVRVL